MSAYAELRAHLRQTAALGEIAGRLGWDQQTVMPRGANDQRAEEMAALEDVLHARRTDPGLGELLARAEAPDETGAAILREARRDYARNTRVPARLASELARVTALSQTAWEEARAADDVAAFLPWLEQVVALRRAEGQAIAQGADAYDALMQDYEPGTDAAQVAGDLRPDAPSAGRFARPYPWRAHTPCPARPFPARRPVAAGKRACRSVRV